MGGRTHERMADEQTGGRAGGQSDGRTRRLATEWMSGRIAEGVCVRFCVHLCLAASSTISGSKY